MLIRTAGRLNSSRNWRYLGIVKKVFVNLKIFWIWTEEVALRGWIFWNIPFIFTLIESPENSKDRIAMHPFLSKTKTEFFPLPSFHQIQNWQTKRSQKTLMWLPHKSTHTNHKVHTHGEPTKINSAEKTEIRHTAYHDYVI